MKILFLASGRLAPSTRFRIVPYLKHFREDGHRCTVANSFPQKYDYFPWMGFRPSQLLKRSVRWWHWLRAFLGRYDLVYIEREIFDDSTSDMEERFRRACGRLVLDIDDAVFLRYPQKFERLLPMADLVVCGNRFLEERIAQWNPVTLQIPTCVSIEKYSTPGPAKTSTRPVVGWMGTTSNLRYLSVAADALRSVAAEIEFELHLFVPELSALGEIDLTGVKIVHRPWSAREEVRQLQSIDVGLMPLYSDQEWDRFKCGMKLIQYLAVGVPGIASPVGVNTDILDHEQNGFSARSTDEWKKALQILLTNRDLRCRMGRSGHEFVRQHYSIHVHYPVLRDALMQL